jgi:hypothetical protein
MGAAVRDRELFAERQRASAAPEQVQPEPDAVKSMLMDIAIYVIERDGRVDPNDYSWRLLVLRAKATLEFKASASKLFPVAREQ